MAAVCRHNGSTALAMPIGLLFFAFYFLFSTSEANAQQLTLVELNCENLFDCRHDTLKQDQEWLPDGLRRWTPGRYWRKLNSIGQELLACQEEAMPDLVALVEVENDSVLRDLTRRSLLRHARYEYLMTESPDLRGIDVALLYQPASFQPLCYDCLEVTPLSGMRPTRDILYVQGMTAGHVSLLHVFVVHAPSRFGGERPTRAHRLAVARRLLTAVDSILAQQPDAAIVVAGDFNDYADSPALQLLEGHGLHNVSHQARGSHGAAGSYRYQGHWQHIDHVLVSRRLLTCVDEVRVNDAPFLLEPDSRYGGQRPLRTFAGYRYQRGFSDHLPLFVRFRLTAP